MDIQVNLQCNAYIDIDDNEFGGSISNISLVGFTGIETIPINLQEKVKQFIISLINEENLQQELK
jgi:hypothetical protein